MGKTVICKTIDGGSVEVSVSELTLRPSAYGVAFKDDCVLLVPQFDGYDFPGGGMDMGELLTDTLVREIKEETGLDSKPGQVLLVQDAFFFHPYKKKPLQTPLLYFLCEIVGGELSTDGFDTHEKDYAKKADWVPISKIDSLKYVNPIDSPKLIKDALWFRDVLQGRMS